MQHEPSADDQSPEPSRWVRNPTQAEPGDDAVYQAADPVPDDDSTPAEPVGSSGSGTTERAAVETADADDSEPDRSE